MGPRVLVVDDSSFVRKAVARALERDGVEIVGFAADGEEASDKNIELEPDVIVLDLQMPRANGVEAIRRFNDTRPVPTLVFASMGEGGAELAVAALAEGAVDVLPKPEAGELTTDLAARVWALATRSQARAERRRRPSMRKTPRVLIVAASTGGPPLVERLLSSLPRSFPIPVLVAQHMPAGFTRAFAHRLDRLTALRVFEGEDGDIVGPGVACVLPGGVVTTLRALEGVPTAFALRVTAGSALPGAKPNATALMLSAVGATGGNVCGVILTGMGADGADAVPALLWAGGTVLVQDPEEALIASMPNAALAAGARSPLPLDGIIARLTGVPARAAGGRAG